MSKPLDPDWLALKQASRALNQSCPRMRRATLEWLWDVYVVRAGKAPKQTKRCQHVSKEV